MTSYPITQGIPNLSAGFQNQGRTGGMQKDNDFENFLKNEKQETYEKPETVNAKVKVENSSDRVKTQNKIGNAAARKTQGEAEVPKKDADACVEEMLNLLAGQFQMSVPKLQNLLEQGGLGKEELLTVEGVKEALLLVSGEDATALITDDTLFAKFQELEDALGTVLEGLEGTNENGTKELGKDFLQPQNVSEDANGMKTQETSKQGEEQSAKEDNSSQNLLDQKGIAFDRMMDQKADTQSFQVQTDTVRYLDEETIHIMDQITKYIKVTNLDGLTEMDLQLQPASLGNLHIHLSSKEGVLTAQFTAANDTVKEVLQSQMMDLTESFKEQGITVEAIEVMVSSHKFEQSYEQAKDEENRSEKQAGSRKVRRVSLDALEEEELTEELNLAKEMMEANGGTVDYMA